MMKKEKLYLVDGSALFYRSYYAFIRNPLYNSKGENTSAAFGVASSLIRLLQDKKPDYLAVIFDRPEPTFRHLLFDAYKANRPEMPEEMSALIPRVKEVIASLHIPLVEMPGYEADDIMGTVCKRAIQEKVEVILVTSDKDMMQLVTNDIKMLKPAISGKGEEVIDETGVEAKWGVHPNQIIDLLALMGDSSDNIPGVSGIGPKTAQVLLKQFQSIDNLLNHIPQINPESLRKKIESSLNLIELSKKLATLHCDVPVSTDFRDWKVRLQTDEKLNHLFQELGFKNLLKMFERDSSSPQPVPLDESATKKEKATSSRQTIEKDYILIKNFSELEELAKKLKKQKWIAFDTETTNIDPLRADLVGCSFSFREHQAYYAPAFFSEEARPAVLQVPGKQISMLDHPETGIKIKNWKINKELVRILEMLKPILENDQIKKIGQNIKYDMLVLSNYEIEIRGVEFDTMIASYLLNPGGRQHNIDDMSEEHLSYKKITTHEIIGTGRNQVTMDQVDIEKVANYACEDADVAFQLKEVFEPKLIENGLQKLFKEVEIPLITVLMWMEKNGVRIDVPFLKAMSIELEDQMKIIEREIYEIAKEKFNINSSQQLGTILFEKLKVHEAAGILKPRKTKTGQYSTDVGVLENLAIHPLPKSILDYRLLAKLKSTYVDALPLLVNPRTGRVHTSYNQAVAATGRLSSADPNLQNIPIRTEQGREIRKAFIAGDPTRLIASADYSQVELRILAHVTGDHNLIQAFLNNEDIHLSTAAKIFGVSPENVTKQMRSDAKAINFGIIYGMEAFGLSRRTGMSAADSRSFIDNYFQLYPGIRKFIENIKVKAKNDGYVTTLLNRRRYLPEIQSKDQNIRKFGERTAINTVIQGTAADLIKVAMIQIHQWIQRNKYETLMILQVHDELVFDVPKKELENVKKNVKLLMESAFPDIHVPLKVDVGAGENWFEAH